MGLVLATAAAASVLGGSTAEASPGRAGQAGDCVQVMRFRYGMPDTIEAPETPGDYGVENPTSADSTYLVTFCDPEKDGSWTKTEDPFPYDQADLCVSISYDPEQHAGASPPDEITTLGEIDRYGTLDGSGGFTGTESLEQYCRSGDVWTRGARPDGTEDFPAGNWRDWAEGDCVTIVPIRDTPRRIDQHPEQYGQVLDENPMDQIGVKLQYIDVRGLRTYCPHSGLWYRVDDYPVEEIVTNEDYRLQNPGQGTCVVNVGGVGEGLPEEIVPPGHPGDLGPFVSRQDYENHPAYSDDELAQDHLFCFVNGMWRRGDKLSEGCAGAEDPHIVEEEGLLPDRCWGTFPTTNYDIGYRGGWDIPRELYGWWTDFFFGIGKGVTNIALWSTDWAYGFDVTRFSQLALDLGADYEVNLTANVDFRLEELAFLILVAWMAVMILRGKMAMAGGELVMSLILMTLVGVLLLNRGDYMFSAWDVMDRSAKDLLVAGQGEDPTTYEGDYKQVIREAEAQMHQVLVEDPYDYLNWGRRLEGECADARNQILALGPWGNRDEPRTMMRAAGCEREAVFNEEPNSTRLLGATLTMVAAVLVGLLLTSVALTVVLAKIVVLALFALVPFVAIAVILPAGGRRMAWLWVMVAVQAVVAVVGTTLVLSMLVMALRRLMELTTDVGIIERFGILVLLVLVAGQARKRLLASGQASAGRMADNLTNSFRLGGGGEPWQGPRGSGGVDLLAADRGLNRTLATAGRAAYGTAQWAVGTALVGGSLVSAGSTLWNRPLRNLRKMERYKERRDGLVGMTFARGFAATRDSLSSVPSGGRGSRGGGGGGAPPAPPSPGGGGGISPGEKTLGGSGVRSSGATATARQQASFALNRRSSRPEQRYVDFRRYRFWQGVDRAEQRYAKDRQLNLDPQFARDTFAARIQHHAGRFERLTGRPAPMAREPWNMGPPARPGSPSAGAPAPIPRPPGSPVPPTAGSGGRPIVPTGGSRRASDRPGGNFHGRNPGPSPQPQAPVPPPPTTGPPAPDPYAAGGHLNPGFDAPPPVGPYERTANAAHRLGDRFAEVSRRMADRAAERGNRGRSDQPREGLDRTGNRRWRDTPYIQALRRRQQLRDLGDLGDED